MTPSPVYTERDFDGSAALERQLGSGELPPPVVSTLRLVRGEEVFSVVAADVSKYAAQNVQYSRGAVVSFANPLLLGATVAGSLLFNKAQKDRAEQASRSQWRFLGRVTANFTSQRLALDDWTGSSDFSWARLRSAHVEGTRLLLEFERQDWLAFGIERPRWHQVLALHLAGLSIQPALH